MLIEAVGETFEVDIRGVHVPEELGPRFCRDVSRAHGYGADSSFAAGLCHVYRVFEKNHRIVVGEGNGPAAAARRRFGNRRGRRPVLDAIERPGFRDIPVLAKLAGQIAAGGSKREDWSTGQEMIERFFFDRVNAKARRAAVGRQHHLVAQPPPHKAQTALAFVQLAIPRTHVALDATIFQHVPIAARHTLNDRLIHGAKDVS